MHVLMNMSNLQHGESLWEMSVHTVDSISTESIGLMIQTLADVAEYLGNYLNRLLDYLKYKKNVTKILKK